MEGHVNGGCFQRESIPEVRNTIISLHTDLVVVVIPRHMIPQQEILGMAVNKLFKYYLRKLNYEWLLSKHHPPETLREIISSESITIGFIECLLTNTLMALIITM